MTQTINFSTKSLVDSGLHPCRFAEWLTRCGHRRRVNARCEEAREINPCWWSAEVYFDLMDTP